MIDTNKPFEFDVNVENHEICLRLIVTITMHFCFHEGYIQGGAKTPRTSLS